MCDRTAPGEHHSFISSIVNNVSLINCPSRSYFFTTEEIGDLFESNGFSVQSNLYINRRTINKKESLDVPRTFIQGKYTRKE